MEKVRSNLIRAFYIVFAICFTFVIISAIFRSIYYKIPYLVILIPLFAVGLCLVYNLCGGRCEHFLEKNYKKILIIFTAAMFLTEMITGIILRHGVGYDIESVNQGAIEWVETGTFSTYYRYMCECPNNQGPMMFYFIFFKLASFIGITDYYAVAVFIDAVMLSAAMALVSLICLRLTKSFQTAVFALAVFALSAPYWFAAAANYTDVMSMLFPALVYWLYLKAYDLRGKQQIIIYLLTGLALAVGSLIKFPVFVMIIALAIDICLRARPKQLIKFFVCVFSVFALVMVSFNGYMYSRHLDREMAENSRRPYTHWMMMGLKGYGGYNPDDFTFTDTTPPEERTEKVNEELVRRIKEHGVTGMINLMSIKSAIDFGDGTYGIADFISIYPAKETALAKWVVYDNEYYGFYSHYATALHIALMLFMLLTSYCFALKKRDEKADKLFAPYLAVFGIWLLLMCWESNRRYASNFGPVIVMCGILGIDNIMNIINKKRKMIVV